MNDYLTEFAKVLVTILSVAGTFALLLGKYPACAAFFSAACFIVLYSLLAGGDDFD